MSKELVTVNLHTVTSLTLDALEVISSVPEIQNFLDVKNFLERLIGKLKSDPQFTRKVTFLQLKIDNSPYRDIINEIMSTMIWLLEFLIETFKPVSNYDRARIEVIDDIDPSLQE